LGLANAFGGTVSSKILNITGSDPIVNRGIASTNGGSTCTVVGTRAQKSFDIIPSTTGSYSITYSAAGSGFLAISVYTSSGFDVNSPCSSTFLGSNAYSTGGGGASANGSFSVNLTACTQYKIIAYASTSAYGDNTINISGAGTLYEVGTVPGGSYGYTFVAVSNADNLIKVVNASSNFTSLAVGSYTVHGISYNTSLTPSSWVGQTVSQVLSSGCVLFSTNSKPVTVTAALPIELLSFSGKWQDNQSYLTWSTASETNNKGFDVERSLTGDKFEKIGFVAGSGNSQVLQAYNLVDADVKTPPQYIYYRLKQLDNDGQFSYSKTIALQPNSKGSFQVFPNPTSGDVVIRSSFEGDRTVSVELIDLLGRTVWQQKQVNMSAVKPFVQNLSALNTGIYHLRIADGREVLHVQRLIKQ
jgi:Secretion system C-terminal sorting domain